MNRARIPAGPIAGLSRKPEAASLAENHGWGVGCQFH